MVSRLPDIPFEFWADDQQERLRKTAQALQDALEFRTATIDLNSQMVDPSLAQQQAAQAEEQLLLAQQEHDRALEEERNRQMMAQQQEIQQRQQDEQAAAQIQAERERVQQAEGIASELGIRTPSSIGDFFGSLVGTKPGTGQQDTTTGAFDSTTQPMGDTAPITDPYAPASAVEQDDDPYGFGITSPNQFAESLGVEPERPYGPTEAEATPSAWQRAYDFGSGLVAPIIREGQELATAWQQQNDRDLPENNVARTAGEAAYGVKSRTSGGGLANMLPSAPPVRGLEPLDPWAGIPQDVQDRNRPAIEAEDARRAAMMADPRYGPGIRAEAEDKTEKARKYLQTFLETPLDIAGETVNSLLSLVNADRDQIDLSRGYGEQFGIGKVGPADVIVNVVNGPAKVFGIAQAADIGAQLVQNPEETTIGLAALAGLAKVLKWNPKVGLALIGATAGGIDAAIRANDIDQSGTGGELTDIAGEATFGGALGLGVARIPAITRQVMEAVKYAAGTKSVQDAAHFLDLGLGRILDEGVELGRSAVNLGRANPEIAAGVGAATAAKALLPGDSESGVSDPAAAGIGAAAVVGATRRNEGAQAVGRVITEAAQNAAPKMADLFQPAMRLYHGTDRAYGKIDVKKFDKDALYGPGLYLTDNADVAAEYSSRSRLQGLRPDHEIRAERAVKELTDAEAKLERWKNIPEERDFWQDQVEMARKLVEETSSQGPNVRAVELPTSLKMFDVRREFTPEEVQFIISDFRTKTGIDIGRNPDADFDDVGDMYLDDLNGRGVRKLLDPRYPTTGAQVYEAIADALPKYREDANKFLASQGFDGLFHEGGNIRPTLDDLGRPIKHEVAVIFPESVEKTRNAFSKEFGHAAIPPGLVEAGAGATAGASQDESASPQDRAGMAAMGAMLAVAGARHIPRTGIWKTRLSQVFRIPDGLPEAAKKQLQLAFDGAAEAIAKSSEAKGAKKTMYWRRQADAAWDKFESLRAALGISDTVDSTTSGVRDVPTAPLRPERLPVGLSEGSERVVGTDPRTQVPGSDVSQYDVRPDSTGVRGTQPVVAESPRGGEVLPTGYRSALPEEPTGRTYASSQPQPTQGDLNRPPSTAEATIAGNNVDPEALAAAELRLDDLVARATTRYGGTEVARLLDGGSSDAIPFADRRLIRSAQRRIEDIRNGVAAPEATPTPIRQVESTSDSLPQPEVAPYTLDELADDYARHLGLRPTAQNRTKALRMLYGSEPGYDPKTDAVYRQEYSKLQPVGSGEPKPFTEGTRFPGEEDDMLRGDDLVDELDDGLEALPPEKWEPLGDYPTNKNGDPSHAKAKSVGAKLLDDLNREGWEFDDAQSAYDDFMDIRREDFERGAGGTEDYLSAKQEAWDSFYTALQDVTRQKTVDSPQNLNSMAGGLVGAASGGVAGQDEDDPETEVPLEEMAAGLIAGTIFGRKKVVAPAFANNRALRNNPINRMMASPSPQTPIVRKGFFERISEFWKTKMTDDIAVLQGWTSDLADEFKKQTGKLLPASTLAAEIKRFDPINAIKQEANVRLKPALQYFGRISSGENAIPEGDIEAYFAAKHNIDIARNIGIRQTPGPVVVTTQQGNLNRIFPGRPANTPQLGASYQDSLDSVANFERDFIATHGQQGWNEFQRHADSVWAYGDFMLETAMNSGLITSKTYRELGKAYPHWMPTRIINYLERSSDAGGIGSGKSLSVGSNNIHELSYGGTGQEAMTPLAALLAESYRVYTAAQKNQVFNAVHEMIQFSHGNVAGYDPTRASERLRRFNKTTIFEIGINDRTPDGYVPLEGYVDGVKIKYAVHEDLGDVVKFAKPTVIPILSGLMSVFRAGATARNPVFLTANAALDFSTYLQRELTRAGGPQAIVPVVQAYAEAASEFLPLASSLGTIAGGAAGAMSIDKDDSVWEQAAKVVGGAGAGMGAGLLRGRDRQVIREIANNEYSGKMLDFLREGGGTAGGYFTPTRRPLEEVNVFGTALDQRIQKVLESFGIDRASEAQREVRELQRPGMLAMRSPAEALRVLKDIALLKPVEALGQRIELVPRVAARNLARGRSQGGIDTLTQELAAARAAVATGGTPSRPVAEIAADLADATTRQTIEGTQAGRTTTIDFNKGGTWARNINQIIPFFNVGVQSTAELQRAYKENPGAYLTSLGMTVMAPLVIAETLNNWDEQTQKDYADVPGYIKDQGIVLMLPRSIFKPSVDEQGNEHPQFLHYRLRNLAPLAIFTRELLGRTIFNNEAVAANRRNPLEVAMAMFAPLLPMSATSTEDLAMSLVPPGLSTVQQLQNNRDTFRGSRIVSAQADDRASPLSKGLANLTGIGRPSQWEFGTRDIGTGYANMLHGASGILGQTPTNSPQSAPFVGGLYGRWVKGSIGENAQFAQDHPISATNRAKILSSGIYWAPDAADPEIGGAPLTRAEQAEYQRLMNQYVDEALTDMLNSDWYNDPKLSRAEKEAELKLGVSKVRDQVRKFYAKKLGSGTIIERVDREYDKGRISADEARRKAETARGTK